jgi:hypothetical protein
VPAAAVIPAPIAYIKVVAVKKLVVEFLVQVAVAREPVLLASCLDHGHSLVALAEFGILVIYFEKIRVFKAGVCLNTLAWNNGIGLWFYFVGF